MKNKKLKRPKTKKSLIVLGVILIALGGLGYFTFAMDDKTEVSQEEQKSAEQSDVDRAKQKVEEESESEPLKDNDTDQSSTPSNANIGLSGLTFSQTNGQINAGVSVSGATSGSCSFIFTDGDGRAITKTSQISGASCSVTTSEAEFSMLGKYDLTAKVSDKTISKTITIN